MPAGRPTDYRIEFCEQVIELGKQGKSVIQMACELGVVKQTMLNWTDFYPEFMDALHQAKQFSQDWWENTAQMHTVETPGGAKVNSGLWSRSMAARFPDDYREKQTIEHAGEVKTTAPVLNIFTNSNKAEVIDNE